MTYFQFIKKHIRFLLFGFLLMLYSSFGQTFFISLFNKEIREEFHLTHGDYGLIYSIATFASGILIIWIGKFIDKINLKNFVLFVTLGLFCGIIFLSISSSVIFLCVAIFMLRFFGQGLMPHTAMTSMARYYDKNRGKAISLASLGLPFGEIVLPALVIILVSILGWKLTWVSASVLLFLSIIPIRLYFLKNYSTIHEKWLLKNDRDIISPKNNTIKNFTRIDVLLDIKFYFIIFSILSPAYIMTGLFFHQIHLFDSKGWSLNLLAGTFAIYALITVSSSLLVGKLIDIFGSKKLIIIHLIPLGLGLFILSIFSSPITALVYLGLAGITVGMANSLLSSLWAEIYGTKHIGAIKSLVTASMVFASALSPFMFGFAIDNGTSIEIIILFCSLYILLSVSILFYIFNKSIK